MSQIPSDKQINAAIQANPQDRTFKLITESGEQFWVKTPSKPRLRWLYTVTNKLMVWLHMPYFQAPPHAGGPGGAASLRIEEKMLKSLHQAGIRVPQVVASNNKNTNPWLLLKSVGEKNLDEQLKALPLPERYTLWQQAVKAIAYVHAQGCYLSQCFARNMLLSENKIQSKNDHNNETMTPHESALSSYEISFLDFEEDPAVVMSKPQAQVRDWALFLHSTASLVTQDLPACQTFLAQYLQKESEDTRQEAKRLFRQLTRLRWLKKFQWLGRDGVRLYQLGLFAEGFQTRL